MKHRAAQIPEAWLNEWRRKIKKTRTLDIDQLSRIAMLTPAQLWENVADDDVLGGDLVITVVTSNQDILKIYARLGRNERQALFSRNGLDLRLLPPHISAVLPEALRVDSRSSFDADTPTRLLARRGGIGSQFQYVFTFTAAGQETKEWRLVTPKYESKDDSTSKNE